MFRRCLSGILTVVVLAAITACSGQSNEDKVLSRLPERLASILRQHKVSVDHEYKKSVRLSLTLPPAVMVELTQNDLPQLLEAAYKLYPAWKDYKELRLFLRVSSIDRPFASLELTDGKSSFSAGDFKYLRCGLRVLTADRPKIITLVKQMRQVVDRLGREYLSGADPVKIRATAARLGDDWRRVFTDVFSGQADCRPIFFNPEGRARYFAFKVLGWLDDPDPPRPDIIKKNLAKMNAVNLGSAAGG